MLQSQQMLQQAARTVWQCQLGSSRTAHQQRELLRWYLLPVLQQQQLEMLPKLSRRQLLMLTVQQHPWHQWVSSWQLSCLKACRSLLLTQTPPLQRRQHLLSA
jgi:hypothetical protein